MYLLFAFLKRGYLRHINYRMAFALGIINFVVGIVSFFYLSRLIRDADARLLADFGNNAAAFLIVGTTFNTFISVALRAFAGQLQNDQVVGVLEHLLMARIGLTRLALFSTVYDFLWPSVLAIGSLALAATLFAVPLFFGGPSLVVFGLTLSGLVGFGLVSGAVVLVTKQGDPVAVACGVLTTLLSGAYYPLSVLPDWLAAIGFALPTTYSLRALRQTLINGASLADIGGDLAVLTAFALVMVPVGLWAFRAGFDRARREGTLSQY